ncbi:hypothetical protein L9F63_002388, partial [Diploptera punctata]
ISLYVLTNFFSKVIYTFVVKMSVMLRLSQTEDNVVEDPTVIFGSRSRLLYQYVYSIVSIIGSPMIFFLYVAVSCDVPSMEHLIRSDIIIHINVFHQELNFASVKFTGTCVACMGMIVWTVAMSPVQILHYVTFESIELTVFRPFPPIYLALLYYA